MSKAGCLSHEPITSLATWIAAEYRLPKYLEPFLGGNLLAFFLSIQGPCWKKPRSVRTQEIRLVEEPVEEQKR